MYLLIVNIGYSRGYLYLVYMEQTHPPPSTIVMDYTHQKKGLCFITKGMSSYVERTINDTLLDVRLVHTTTLQVEVLEKHKLSIIPGTTTTRRIIREKHVVDDHNSQ